MKIIENIGMDFSQLESQTVYAAIIDSEIYERHKEFFKGHHFRNDLIGKLAEITAETYDRGECDIGAVLDSFVHKYGVSRTKTKFMLAKGITSVKSLSKAESAITEFTKKQAPEGHTTGADENI